MNILQNNYKKNHDLENQLDDLAKLIPEKSKEAIKSKIYQLHLAEKMTTAIECIELHKKFKSIGEAHK